jgi:hypothetical protein
MNEQEKIMNKIKYYLSEHYDSESVNAKTNEMIQEYSNFKLNHPFVEISFPQYFLIQLKALDSVAKYKSSVASRNGRFEIWWRN